MPEPALLATVAGRPLAAMVTGPLLSRARDRVMGVPRRRRLEQLCAEVLTEVVRDSAGNEDADHVLSVLQHAFAANEHRPLRLELTEEWIQDLVTEGVDPETLPVDLGHLLRRVFTVLAQRLRDDATKPESPLFNMVIMERLDVLDKQVANAIPLDAGLQRRLDLAREQCRAADVRFFTAHLLLALLEDGPVGRGCLDAVRPGLADRLTSRLVAYVRGGSPEPYQDFDWSQDATIRQARRLAMQENREQVSDAHVLMAMLEGGQPSATIDELRKGLGPQQFALLLEKVRSAPRKVRRTPTPGPVFGDIWTMN